MADELRCTESDRELFEMCRTGNIAEVTTLIHNSKARPGAYVDYCGKNGLMMAAERGHLDIIKICIVADPSVLLSTCEDDTDAVALAAANGHLQTVQLLLNSQKQYFPKRSFSLTTALSLASYNGHLPCVKLLLQFGADHRTPDTDGAVPLENSKLFGSHPKQKRLQRHEDTAKYLSKL